MRVLNAKHDKLCGLQLKAKTKKLLLTSVNQQTQDAHASISLNKLALLH